MNGLPHRIDRMPREAETLTPARVITVALNSVPYEFYKHMPLSETSEVVLTVLKGLELEGYEIKKKGLVQATGGACGKHGAIT